MIFIHEWNGCADDIMTKAKVLCLPKDSRLSGYPSEFGAATTSWTIACHNSFTYKKLAGIEVKLEVEVEVETEALSLRVSHHCH